MKEYPVSKIQHQFWTINRMYPGDPAYNMASSFRLNGYFDSAILAKSINMIIGRHEIFRTTFRERAEDVVQVVHQSMPADISLEDLRFSPDDINETIDERIKEEISAPFNLNDGPLIRGKIFRTGDDEYYLCITMHHIITDLHSRNLFSEELSLIYNSIISDTEPGINEHGLHYRDYSSWESAQISSGKLNHMLTYWESRLDGGEFFLNLPADHCRTETSTLKGDACYINIPGVITESVRIYSRRNSVNTFVTMLAAYYVLLYKYTCQESVIIGLPLTNRREEEFKDIMGCLMNIIPLRVDNIGSKSFDELVISVRKVMLEAHRNQEIPFQEIIARLKPPRMPGINPVYQIAFAFEPPMKLDLAGVKSISLPAHPGGAQLDLFLTLWEEGSSIRGRVEYNSALFERVSIQNFADNYINLIENLIFNSITPLSGVSLNGGQMSFIESPETTTEDGAGRYSSVNKMIEEQAARVPDKIAAVSGAIGITYRDLNGRANQLAHYLVERGISAESIAGIYIERSIEMLISMIAVHKAGATYLPLDPEFPAARIRYMIEHSKLEIIVTQGTLSAKLPETAVEKIIVDEEWPEIAKRSILNLYIPVRKDSLAYIMYTSGSTGNPKGVQVTHSSVVNFLSGMAKKPGLNEHDTLLAVTTISFDISVLEIFLPLSQGAKTVILPKETSVDGRLLIEALENYKPTVMQATPATWKILFLSGWRGAPNLKALCGGEAMPRDIAQKLAVSVSEVWNMYGPTETTVWSTCCRIINPDAPIYIGEPIDNTFIYILDKELNHVPPGVPGEIYIGGAGVARGYIHEPELTSERFLKDPFRDDEHRIYKTGDTGRITYNGMFEFFSRIDHQVKLRGYRIELQEIEFNINQYQEVSDSAAALIKDQSGNGRIAAYIVTRGGGAISSSDLRLFLQERIPVYMIPDFFIMMDKLPLTPNNKVDRKALPLPDFKCSRDISNVVLPANNMEERLTAIWKEVLSAEIVGINDNYFDLGGNSFLAVRIVNRINRELNSDLTILAFFKYTTISALAKYLSSGIENDSDILVNINERKNRNKEALSRQKQRRNRFAADIVGH